MEAETAHPEAIAALLAELDTWMAKIVADHEETLKHRSKQNLPKFHHPRIYTHLHPRNRCALSNSLE